MKPERNSPCPCGSGKKFKKCHLGRENELNFNEPESVSEESSRNITGLPAVEYGSIKDILSGLDIQALTGKDAGIKFIELKAYSAISSLDGLASPEGRTGGGSIFINIHKTEKSDSRNVYIAVSPDVSDSILAHQTAHALDYLGGSGLMPGMGKALSMELSVPVEHLEHPMEFAGRLDMLNKKFDILPDADDSIILFLFSHGKLLTAEEIRNADYDLLKQKSREILVFLNNNGPEINEIIRERQGYLGSQLNKD